MPLTVTSLASAAVLAFLALCAVIVAVGVCREDSVPDRTRAALRAFRNTRERA